MEVLRLLLMPFALLYGAGIALRNLFYDNGYFKSVEFDLPVISVGNLSVGGTGKTPHIEFLVRLLKPTSHVAILSRGYKRQTSGYILAQPHSTADEIGDEPRQFKLRFPDVTVAVGENRMLAVPQLLMDVPQTDVLLLDDAFQHRAVQPGLSILLTEYDNLFSSDFILPIGRLREPRAAAKRADIIVISKCPTDLTEKSRQEVAKKVKPLPHQKLFFSYLIYHTPYFLLNYHQQLPLSKDLNVLLLTGIAQPEHLEQFVKQRVNQCWVKVFEDHHRYDRYDLENIRDTFLNIESNNKIILTTEKDAMRLHANADWISQNKIPVFVIPVEVDFFEKDKEHFSQLVLDYVEHNKK